MVKFTCVTQNQHREGNALSLGLPLLVGWLMLLGAASFRGSFSQLSNGVGGACTDEFKQG
jgi:hypothetical protein